MSDLNHPETTIRRAALIRDKGFLRRLYREWYEEIVAHIPDAGGGRILELGSGGGFLKSLLPDAVTSDVLHLPMVDLLADARHLPIQSATLKAIAMVDVFHHIPDVSRFLSEALRCLNTGGRLIMVEPWMTPVSAWIYKRLHHEPCLPAASDWSLRGRGPLSTANSALPWMVFDRDDAIRRKAFPQLRLDGIRLHTPIRYLLSGGVARQWGAPEAFFSPVRRLETAIGPAMGLCAMFATIVISRR